MVPNLVIGSRQIKAARALLDWSQEDLASSATLSVATIRKLELGFIPRLSTAIAIRKTFEQEGIEFLDSEGVRRRRQTMSMFEGPEGCAAFINDVLENAGKQGGEVMIVSESLLTMIPLVGARPAQALEGAANRGGVRMRILLADAFELPISGPTVEYRSLSTHYIDPMSFCVYGDRYAMVTSTASEPPAIVVVQSHVVASASRRQFESMWDKAMAFRALPNVAARPAVALRAI